MEKLMNQVLFDQVSLFFLKKQNSNQTKWRWRNIGLYVYMLIYWENNVRMI